jgi:hypothetical protein
MKLYACLMLDFGSDEEKLQGIGEVKQIAFDDANQTNESTVDDCEEDGESQL